MKKTKRMIVLLIVLVVLLIPMRFAFKDGGTVEYHAVLYRLTFHHSIDDRYPSGFYEATTFGIFPFYLVDLELTLNEPNSKLT